MAAMPPTMRAVTNFRERRTLAAKKDFGHLKVMPATDFVSLNENQTFQIYERLPMWPFVFVFMMIKQKYERPSALRYWGTNMLLIQKLGRTFLNISGMMMAALLAWNGPAMAEENLPPEVASGAESGVQSVQCKELKPYNNLDELLYQFYVNRENDCFEYMSAVELEKIWDVKILSEERAKPAVYYTLSEVEFYNKPYRSERDAFYIEMAANRGGLRKIFFL